MPIGLQTVSVGLGIVIAVGGILTGIYTAGSTMSNISARLSNLEDQIHNLTTRMDQANGQIGTLSERVRVLEIPLGDMKQQLQAINGKANDALSEASKKPPLLVNPLQERCSELTLEADTGHRVGFSGWDQNVADRALILIKTLACSNASR